MLTIEKSAEIVRQAKEIENGSYVFNLDTACHFLASVKTLTECLEIQAEKVKNSLLNSGFTAEKIVNEYDKKIVYSDGKISVSYATEKIYKELKAIGKEKLFPEIVKIQKNLIEKNSDADIFSIAEKFSISEKGNPFIMISKLSKKDKITG